MKSLLYFLAFVGLQFTQGQSIHKSSVQIQFLHDAETEMAYMVKIDFNSDSLGETIQKYDLSTEDSISLNLQPGLYALSNVDGFSSVTDFLVHSPIEGKSNTLCPNFYNDNHYFFASDSSTQIDTHILNEFYTDFAKFDFNDGLVDTSKIEFKKISITEAYNLLETQKQKFLTQIGSTYISNSSELNNLIHSEIELIILKQLLQWYLNAYPDEELAPEIVTQINKWKSGHWSEYSIQNYQVGLLVQRL